MDAFEQFEDIMLRRKCDWQKGLRFAEPSYHFIEPETLIGRHHQISVCLQPDYAPLAKCPEGLDKQLYLKARSQERLDNILCD